MKLVFNSILTLSLGILIFFGLKSSSSNKLKTTEFNVNTSSLNTTTTVTTQEIIDLANAFKATLTASQITTLQLSYSLTNARTWSNLPASMSARLGLKMGTLTAPQLAAAKALVQAMTGTPIGEGYNEVQGLWAADDYLSVNGGGTNYGAGNFYISFFGTPAMTGTFEIQMTGHHRTVSNTYINGNLVGATPSFVATEPYASFTSGGNTYQPMLEEKTALVNMLSGLTATQLTTAHLTTTFTDIVCGPQKDWMFPTTKVGLQANTLTASQKQLILNAIATYVNDVDDTSAATFMTQYTAEIDNTYIVYSGTATLNNQNDYIRIDGPSVWIEYSTQNGIILSPKHPHSIWRDHAKDYGGTGAPLSTTNFSLASRIANFPNPVTENTTFNFNLKESAIVKINLYDLHGKLVVTPYKNSLNAGNNSLTVDLSDLSSGTYIYFIETNGVRSNSSKLIKK
ncbi:DUF3500 domain-containing protein [Flavobacterium paronense]|uniref:DUF3500 domain-containing protein n=1 Tax=Flavobacterium paronense TaxID=1392775 RepID=A0ABV5GD09_9FLAO|nr:DUF3500 domain-containing protein [Flavobacterium paronense]MDN3676168.1 DUF3500 domain-containing protein [Flavobacterium paronense]